MASPAKAKLRTNRNSTPSTQHFTFVFKILSCNYQDEGLLSVKGGNSPMCLHYLRTVQLALQTFNSITEK